VSCVKCGHLYCVCEDPNAAGSIATVLLNTLRKFTQEQRRHVFEAVGREFCLGCGGPGGEHYCWYATVPEMR
jgi:hypothetical protein